MDMKEFDRKTYIADSAQAFADRRITKRQFLRRLAIAGVGLSSFAATMLGRTRPFPGLTPPAARADTGASPEMTKWLQDVGSKYKGTKIRYTSEATPPTIVANQLAKDEFTANTGIEVEIEIVPLEQVLQKATVDVQGQLGSYDLYYLDQSWTALFINDTLDPQAVLRRQEGHRAPGFRLGRFLQAPGPGHLDL